MNIFFCNIFSHCHHFLHTWLCVHGEHHKYCFAYFGFIKNCFPSNGMRGTNTRNIIEREREREKLEATLVRYKHITDDHPINYKCACRCKFWNRKTSMCLTDVFVNEWERMGNFVGCFVAKADKTLFNNHRTEKQHEKRI